MKKKSKMNNATKEVKDKKRKVSPMNTLLGIIMIVVIGIMGYEVYKEIVVTLNLQGEIAQLSGDISNLNNQKDTLTKQADNLNDPAYVEQFARGKYKLTKEGETIYKLPGKTTSESEDGN